MYIDTEVCAFDSFMPYVLFLCVELSNTVHVHTHFYPFKYPGQL